MIVSNIYSGGDTSRLTLPFGIEEAMPIIKGKVNKLDLTDLTELVIDLFDGAISVNMKTGVLKPKTVHVLATNFEDEETDRSGFALYHYMYTLYSRLLLQI